MGDEEKNGSLFTSDNDNLSKEEAANIKKRFYAAEKNESPMWQDVISFDNAWLEEQSIFQSNTEELDEQKLKNVVRGTMDTLLKSEHMDKSAIWTASIHYNTDNIHVHIATVEPIPTRKKINVFDKESEEWKEQYRAKRKQGSLDKMKSSVVNQILDRSDDYNRIDDYIRGTVHHKKQNGIDLSSHRKTRKLFNQAIERMPDDLRQWKYGYQSINDARPYIDEIVDVYLETYHKNEMKELDTLLDKQVDISERLYGEDSRHDQYKETKLDDLKKRMGNAVLAEMRSYKINEKNQSFRNQKFKGKSKHSNSPFNNWKNESGTGTEIHSAMMRLRYAMRKSFQEHQKERNVDEYDRMIDGHER